MARLMKKLKRNTHISFKYQFDVCCVDLQLERLPGTNIPPKGEHKQPLLGNCFVAWTRGPKVCKTQDTPLILSEESLVSSPTVGCYRWNETLSMVSKLYRDKATQKFEEKSSKFSVIEIKGRNRRTLGSVTADLTRFTDVGDLMGRQLLVMQLSVPKVGTFKAVLQITISARWIRDSLNVAPSVSEYSWDDQVNMSEAERLSVGGPMRSTHSEDGGITYDQTLRRDYQELKLKLKEKEEAYDDLLFRSELDKTALKQELYDLRRQSYNSITSPTPSNPSTSTLNAEHIAQLLDASFREQWQSFEETVLRSHRRVDSRIENLRRKIHHARGGIHEMSTERDVLRSSLVDMNLRYQTLFEERKAVDRKYRELLKQQQQQQQQQQQEQQQQQSSEQSGSRLERSFTKESTQSDSSFSRERESEIQALQQQLVEMSQSNHEKLTEAKKDIDMLRSELDEQCSLLAEVAKEGDEALLLEEQRSMDLENELHDTKLAYENQIQSLKDELERFRNAPQPSPTPQPDNDAGERVPPPSLASPEPIVISNINDADSDLLATVSSLLEEKKQIETALAAAEKQNAIATTSLVALEKDNANMLNNVSELEHRLASTQSELQSTQQQYSDQERVREFLQRKADELERTVGELETRIEESKGDESSHGDPAELDAVTAQLQELRQLEQANRQNIDELESELKQKTKEAAEHAERERDWKEEKSRLVRLAEDLKGELSRMQLGIVEEEGDIALNRSTSSPASVNTNADINGLKTPDGTPTQQLPPSSNPRTSSTFSTWSTKFRPKSMSPAQWFNSPTMPFGSPSNAVGGTSSRTPEQKVSDLMKQLNHTREAYIRLVQGMTAMETKLANSNAEKEEYVAEIHSLNEMKKFMAAEVKSLESKLKSTESTLSRVEGERDELSKKLSESDFESNMAGEACRASADGDGVGGGRSPTTVTVKRSQAEDPLPEGKGGG